MPEDTQNIDLDARYTVSGYEGIAFYLRGYAETDALGECVGHVSEEDGAEGVFSYDCDGSCNPERVEDREHVRAVMVGDDRELIVSVDDLTVLDEDAYCHQCGQIGCDHDGRER